MSTQIERNILTIIEPTIELDELFIPDAESGTDNSDGVTMKEKLSKFSSIIPLIVINQYQVQMDRLKYFSLESTGFYPTLTVRFADTDGLFTARNYPKDGDIIQLYIRSQGEETTFKPIRIDFTIIDCSPAGGGGGMTAKEYNIFGRMFIPDLFTEKVEYEENVTSWDALSNIAERLKIGYASNVEDTADQMTWTNPNDTTETWIQDIVANSYLSDETFFTSYIDPYYYLTMVDVNRLFDQDKSELEVSQSFSTNASDTYGADGATGETPFPNLLSNLIQMQGGARYLSKYKPTNKSGEISKANGYKRYTQYWDLEAKQWISEFVDPLTNGTEGTIPATKGRVINGEPEGPRNSQVKYKYLGTQGDNVHPEFQYAVVQNYQNNSEIEKMGMEVELDAVNPALTRYSRIYLLIFEYGSPVKNVLTEQRDGVAQTGDPTPQDRERSDEDEPKGPGSGILNEYLSGFYVITGIEYLLTQPGPLRMRLQLQRREYTPTT